MGDPVTDVGDGFNVFINSAQPSLVTISPVTRPHKHDVSVSICLSTYELLSRMDIDASISASNVWGSFQDRTTFASKLLQNTTSITILVVANLTRQTTEHQVAFTIPPSSAAEVFREGGDSYVSTVDRGAQYIAAYTFTAYDQETYDSLKTSANLNFPTGGLSTSFGASISQITSETNVAAKFNQIGPGVLYFPTEENMVNFALNFSWADIDPEPPVVAFNIRSYSKMPGCPVEFAQVDKYRKEFFNPLDPEVGLAYKELLAKDNKRVITPVYNTYNYYNFLSVDPQLSKTLDGINAIKTAIEDWRSAIDSDPINPNHKPPVIDPKALLVPFPRYSFEQVNWAGGSGGYFFQDISYEMIASGAMPAKVIVRGGDIIDRLTTTYIFQDSTSPLTTSHGGDGGRDGPPVNISPGQQVTDIQVYADDALSRMQIFVDGKSNGWWPDNSGGGKNVSWCLPAKDSSFFVGWTGHSGTYLDSLGPLYLEFNKCDWKKPAVPKPNKRHRGQHTIKENGFAEHVSDKHGFKHPHRFHVVEVVGVNGH